MLNNEEKHKMRQSMLLCRQQIPEDQRLKKEAQIHDLCEKFCKEHAITQTIGGYRALRGELSLDALIFSSTYEWAFPKVYGSEIVFYNCSEKAHFEAGSFGINEPLESQTKLKLENCDLIFVPGVAFDRKGRRLGMGKGFYDRALADFKGLKVGVAFETQISNTEIPYENHDIQMDYVITEKFIISPIQRKRSS